MVLLTCCQMCSVWKFDSCNEPCNGIYALDLFSKPWWFNLVFEGLGKKSSNWNFTLWFHVKIVHFGSLFEQYDVLKKSQGKKWKIREIDRLLICFKNSLLLSFYLNRNQSGLNKQIIKFHEIVTIFIKVFKIWSLLFKDVP